MTTQAIPTAQLDILETAVSAGTFKTLATALEAAGLADALKGAGPFTVFAPTDGSIRQITQGAGQILLQPDSKDKLTPSSRITCCRRESLPRKLFISAQQRL
jgi:Secreted and surface protein containing fasciclin-like repeats